MKIVVPIDFQSTSFAAYRYATHLADALKAELTVLHIHPGGMSIDTALSYESVDERVDRLKKRMKYFTTIYPNQQNLDVKQVPINYEVRFGIPGFTVSDFANDLNFDLVVMGTKDKHFMLERVMGSTSSITIDRSKSPVLLIHENTLFNPIERIVFGFDKKGDIENPINQFLSFNDILQARTDFIHVSKTEKVDLKETMDQIVGELFEKHNPSFSFEIKRLKGSQTMDALKDYCMQHKADMLALVHQKKGLVSHMLQQSVSIRMAQDFHLPVIIFK